MKINSNNPHFDIKKQQPTDRQQQTGTDFKDVLKETASRHSADKTGDKAPMPTMAAGSLHLQFRPEVAPQAVAERVDRFLDVLDQYRAGLADPNMTLKNLFPLLQQIETEKQQLDAIGKNLPEGNRLKPILDEALVTGTLEVVKFNRGDYV